MLPPAFIRGDRKGALARLGTRAGADDFRRASALEYPGWDNFAVALGWDRIVVSGVSDPENEKYVGLDISSAAARFGFEDGAALAAHLMHTDAGKTANAGRMIFDRLDGSLRFLGAVDPWDMQTLCARIHIAQNDRWQIGGDANHRRHVAQLSGTHHVFAIARLNHPVLGVEHAKVPALVANDFDQRRIGIADKNTIDSFTCL